MSDVMSPYQVSEALLPPGEANLARYIFVRQMYLGNGGAEEWAEWPPWAIWMHEVISPA
ncbi:hypothetical protein FOXYSP1_08789 [Fusarium oxysporum f. sp. phaseoli]